MPVSLPYGSPRPKRPEQLRPPEKMWLSQEDPCRPPECACVSVSTSEQWVPFGIPKAKGRLTVGLVLGSGQVRTESLGAQRPAGARRSTARSWGFSGASWACPMLGPGPPKSPASASAVVAKEGVLRKAKRKGEERREVGRLGGRRGDRRVWAPQGQPCSCCSPQAQPGIQL